MYVPLNDYEEEFEILDVYPHTIRRRDNHEPVNETRHSKGYIQLSLKGRLQLKHILIGKQFIPNPNNLSQLDHVNKDRTDNRIENLRWVSASENMRNRSSYKGIKPEYVNEISQDAVMIESYKLKNNKERIYSKDRYYYDNEKFYMKITDNLYKILHVYKNNYINTRDCDNKIVSLNIARWLDLQSNKQR